MKANRAAINSELQAFLKQYTAILNFTNLERQAGLPVTILSQVKSGRRTISYSQALHLCKRLQAMMKDIHKAINVVGEEFSK